MAFSEGVQKDIVMCKMQRALQKRMHPFIVSVIQPVTTQRAAIE